MIEWTDFGCVHKSGRHELRMFMENQIEKYSCKAREKTQHIQCLLNMLLLQTILSGYSIYKRPKTTEGFIF